LLACTISFALMPLQFYALPLLAMPLAALLGLRHGPAALRPVSVMLAPMLVSLAFGPLATAGSLGLYLSALLVARIAGDATLRHAILQADQPPSPWALGFMLFGLPWFVATPWFSGIRLAIDLWVLMMTLLLTVGLGRTPLRAVLPWLAGAWLFGAVLHGLGLRFSSAFGSLAFTLSSPSDLLTALTMLGGPRLLRAVRPATIRLSPPVLVGVLATFIVSAVLARVRVTPGIDSLFGRIGPLGFTTDFMTALLAAGLAIAIAPRWWVAPIAFAGIRVPLSLLLPMGLSGTYLSLSPGGLLQTTCQTAVIAAFAWVALRACQADTVPAATGVGGGFDPVIGACWQAVRSGLLPMLTWVLIIAGLVGAVILD